MPKHTHGPWKVKDNGKGATPSIVTADEFIMTWEIARIKDVPNGAYKANANLIAAAPDLLDICESSLLALKIFSSTCAASDLIVPAWVTKHINLLEDIIAKAKGV